ncbi:hypothetical protein BSP4_10950 [Bacillus subtilis subsp. subtilis]|uniref:hypothetical protein n=1 Tax=Bacillus subtilis TaxID=1423 RepID=UPI000C77C27B|nr:hypothetical protein [Bacillus subtilis]PLV34979.1 hypothetical protein BSP4_10950 [Bacillus subtilis subsp. subtilis]
MLFIIDEILENMVREDKRYFSPHYIISVAANQGENLSLKQVTEYLLSLVPAKLRVYYEVECPNGDSDFAIDSPHQKLDEFKICHICNTEYMPSLDRVWVSFDFTPEYRAYIKKKRVVPKVRRDLLLI